MLPYTTLDATNLSISAVRLQGTRELSYLLVLITPVFLNLSAIDICGQRILLLGTVLCTVGC